MNRLLKAIELLQLHLRENNNGKHSNGKHTNISCSHPATLSAKNNNCYLLFSYYNPNHIFVNYIIYKRTLSQVIVKHVIIIRII